MDPSGNTNGTSCHISSLPEQDHRKTEQDHLRNEDLVSVVQHSFGFAGNHSSTLLLVSGDRVSGTRGRLSIMVERSVYSLGRSYTSKVGGDLDEVDYTLSRLRTV